MNSTRDEATGWYYLYGLGTDAFLRPGAEMEVFLDDTYSRDVHRQSVIGGFDGRSTLRTWLTSILRFKVIDIQRRQVADRARVDIDECWLIVSSTSSPRACAWRIQAS